MTANDLVYGYPLGVDPLLGNVADASSVFVVGAAEASYPLTNIANGNPAKPFKCTGATVQIRWDLGSAKALKYFALIHHNLDNALAGVTLKAGSTIAVADFSQAITIPAADEDGYTVSPWLDLTAVAAYRYWRLNVDTANSANVIFGEICLQLDDRRVAKNYAVGSVRAEIGDWITHQTGLGVELVYNRSTRRKMLSGSFMVSATQLETFLEWWRAVRGQPHLIIPDVANNEAWLARLQVKELAVTFRAPNSRVFSFQIQEVSRGLPWSQV